MLDTVIRREPLVPRSGLAARQHRALVVNPYIWNDLPLELRLLLLIDPTGPYKSLMYFL